MKTLTYNLQYSNPTIMEVLKDLQSGYEVEIYTYTLKGNTQLFTSFKLLNEKQLLNIFNHNNDNTNEEWQKIELDDLLENLF